MLRCSLQSYSQQCSEERCSLQSYLQHCCEGRCNLQSCSQQCCESRCSLQSYLQQCCEKRCSLHDFFSPAQKECDATLVFPTGNKYLAPEFFKTIMMENFAAIDFETANREPSSVCSVGIVIVRAGEICDKFYSLIRPEPEYYFYWNTRVHGLTLEDTEYKGSRADAGRYRPRTLVSRGVGQGSAPHRRSPAGGAQQSVRRGLPARRFPDVSDGLSRLRILLYVSRLAPGLRPGIAQPSTSDSGGALRLRPQGASPRTGRRRGMCVDSKNNIIKVKNGRRFG